MIGYYLDLGCNCMLPMFAGLMRADPHVSAAVVAADFHDRRWSVRGPHVGPGPDSAGHSRKNHAKPRIPANARTESSILDKSRRNVVCKSYFK